MTRSGNAGGAGTAAPRISVIVPIYGTEAYLEKCLRSVMVQTFTDIEILCIDDCSPDRSAAIVERLMAEDSRIVFLRHDRNLGLGGARNTGIRAARAAYIASVDSDDHVDPDFLERLWAGAADGHFDVVVCGYSIVAPDGTVIDSYGYEKQRIIDPIPAEQNPMALSEPAFWNKLWRRSLFVDNDIWFPHHIYHQDAATTPRIYARARNIRFVGGDAYKYLAREGSATLSVSDKHLLDRYRYVDVLKDYFIAEGSFDRLAPAIDERIYRGYAFFAETLIENAQASAAEIDTHLRHLLVMRDAYLRYDTAVRSMSFEEKVDLLVNARPIQTGRDLAPAAPGPQDRPPLPPDPRILVLTLHSGEHEFEASCASLARQTHRNWDHVVFRGLGNHAAHKALYATIMDRRAEYDLFLKLDADMVLARDTVLAEIAGLFRTNPALDHLIVACDDFMTGDRILGVHSFSNRVTWQGDARGLFNDPSPSRPGLRRIIEQPRASFFLHAPDPSSLQAFHFGAHRALKLVQRGQAPADIRAEAMLSQWQTLKGVWRQFDARGDRRHALALVAADLIIGGQLGDAAHDYHDPGLRAAFEAHAHLPADRLARLFRSRWESPAARERYFRRAVGPVALERLAAPDMGAPLDSIADL